MLRDRADFYGGFTVTGPIGCACGQCAKPPAGILHECGCFTCEACNEAAIEHDRAVEEAHRKAKAAMDAAMEEERDLWMLIPDEDL